jgi:hypothetical protein
VHNPKKQEEKEKETKNNLDKRNIIKQMEDLKLTISLITLKTNQLNSPLK